MIPTIALAIALQIPPQPAVLQPKDVTYEQEIKAPFSWFLAPSDVIGFPDCPEGFQLTYDGALVSGFRQYRLVIGNPLQPFNQRIRTLRKGNVPVLQMSSTINGVKYSLETFGTTKDLNPQKDLVAFLRLTAENVSKKGQKATYGITCEQVTGGLRAPVGCEAWYRNQFMDMQKWESDRSIEAVSSLLVNGHVVMSLGIPGGTLHVENENKPATYIKELELKPGQKASAEFKIPYVPVDNKKTAPNSEFYLLTQQSFDQALRDVEKAWSPIYAQATEFVIPESKPVDAYRASLAYLRIARDVQKDPTRFVQKVNEFQYDHFYARDTAFIARMYDMIGLHKVAKEVIQSYLVRDASGKVETMVRTMPDDWGQSIWAIAAHIRATNNFELAREAFAGIPKHVANFRKDIAKDPLGLWPVAGAYDNEVLNGHYTSHSLWALLGLKEAAYLANCVGQPEKAQEYDQLYHEYHNRFLERLKTMLQEGGYIPPGIDKPLDGHDWENASGGVYPFGLLRPDHPWAVATIRLIRETKYREGIMTWGPNAYNLKQQILKGIDPDPLFLHQYETFHVMQTMLTQDRQRDVVEDLYSVLAHTSSTHAGFETSVRPWDRRNTGGNYPPHGWYAARYIEMLRNMLIREWDGDLHLFSVLSPEWVKPGKSVGFKRGSCDFGTIDAMIKVSKAGATINLKPTWSNAPGKVVIHIPWFVKLTNAVADGKIIQVSKGALTVSPQTKLVQIAWTRQQTDTLSYSEAVKLWLQKNYFPKPNEDRMFLFPRPTKPVVVGDTRMFVGSTEIALANPSSKGRIFYTTDGSEPTTKSTLYTKPFKVNQDTKLMAITVWPDGRSSDRMVVNLAKSEYEPAVQVNATKGKISYALATASVEKLPDNPEDLKFRAAGQLDAIQPLVPNGPTDGYALWIKGFFLAEKDGIYTFELGSDDGSKLFVGDRLSIDNDGLHAYRTVLSQHAFKAGWHPISILYFDKGDAEYLRLYVKGPGLDRQLVPSRLLGYAADPKL